MIDKFFQRKYLLVIIIGILSTIIIWRSLSADYNVVSIVGVTLPYHIINLFLITLAIIDRQSLIRKKSTLIWWWICFIIITIIWFIWGVWSGIGLLIWHIGYLSYIRVTYLSITNYRIISLRSIARSWLSIMSMVLAFGYTFLFLSYQKPLDFNCTNLNEQTIWLLTTYLPHSIATDTGTLHTINQKISEIKNKTLWQIIWVQTGVTWYTSWVNIDTGTLLGIIETYKKSFIDDVVLNKSTIDKWVCEFTLDHIKELSKNSTVQISAIILLWLLLSVFTWWLLLICSLVYYIVLWILYYNKVYTISIKSSEHEVIE